MTGSCPRRARSTTPGNTAFTFVKTFSGQPTVAEFRGLSSKATNSRATRSGESIATPRWEFISSTAREFIAVRVASATLVVPVMEELFWRDFLWRSIIAPNDFKLAQIGEWDWKAFVVVTGLFATVHGNWWLTAIVWGAMVAGLLIYTKSLGACIIAHAVTNLLLAIYVLIYKDWAFW